jgi:dephospho-CoA kinase
MTLFIGLSGNILAGKGLVRKVIEENFDTKSFSLSDVIRDELDERGIEKTRNNLITLGNELRRNFGHGVLAKRLLDKALKAKAKIVILDSVRHTAEVQEFRNALGESFMLLFVDAPLQLRYERSLARKREGEGSETLEGFKDEDAREQGLSSAGYEGQQLAACRKEADFLVFNDGTREELEKDVMALVKDLLVKRA